MVKNIFRIVAIFFAFVLIIAVGMLLALRLMFPESRLKNMTVNGLRGFTMRDASLGRISVGFSGLEAADFSVSEFPNFKAGTFLSIPRLSIAFKPLALLERRLMVSQVRLDAPQLTVTIGKDGTSSFDNLIGAGNERKYAPFALLVTDCRVTNGKIVLRDERWDRYTLSARNVDIALNSVSLTSPFPVRITADIEKNGALHADVQGTVDIPREKLRIEPLILKSGAATLTVAGSIDRFRDTTPAFDIRIKGDRVVLDKVLQFFPWASALQFGISPEIDVSVTGTVERLDIRFNKI